MSSRPCLTDRLFPGGGPTGCRTSPDSLDPAREHSGAVCSARTPAYAHPSGTCRPKTEVNVTHFGLRFVTTSVSQKAAVGAIFDPHLYARPEAEGIVSSSVKIQCSPATGRGRVAQKPVA
jgi:hypothetical protein